MRALIFTLAINIGLLQGFTKYILTAIFYIFNESFQSFMFNIPYYTESLLTGTSFVFLFAFFIEILPVLSSNVILKHIYSHIDSYRKAIGNESCMLKNAIDELQSKSKKMINQPNVYVRDLQTINAYSLDGSTLIVTKGLIEKMSATESAAVIAHELGHGVHKDTIVKMMMHLMNMPFYGIFKFFTYPLRIPKNLNDCIKIFISIIVIHFVILRAEPLAMGIPLFLITRVVLEIPVLVLSRLDERMSEFAADRYVCTIGLGYPLLTALKKLKQEDWDEGVFYRLLNGHPRIDQRIGQIEHWLSNNKSSIRPEMEMARA